MGESSVWEAVGGDYPDGGGQEFHFGMHKGQTFIEVLRSHPDYFHWGLGQKEPSPQLSAYLIWVYRHYEVPPVGVGSVSLRRIPLPVEADSLEKLVLLSL